MLPVEAVLSSILAVELILREEWRLVIFLLSLSTSQSSGL